MTGPRPQPFRGVVLAPAERSRDFRGAAIRLVKRLTPQRGLAAAVVGSGAVGVALTVIGPRILGHATDLLFAGVIGRRLPTGITKEQAVAAARARGDGVFADLLSGTKVRPGVGVDFGAVGRTLLTALALYLLASLLTWAQAWLLNIAVRRTMRQLRSDVEDKVHRLPLSYLDRHQRGELLSRVTNDIGNIQTSVSMTLSQLLTSVLTVVGVLVMMLTISPLLAVITLLTVPLSLLATRVIARRSQRLFVAQWANIGRLNAHIEETYSGFTLVKTFGHRAWAEQRFRDLNADVYKASVGAQFFSGLVAPATMFLGNLSYVAVAVIGGLQVATGQVALGGIQAFTQYVRQFNWPLTQVAAMYTTLQSGIASAERVFDLLDAPEEEPDTAGGLPWVNGHRGRVEFQRVNFGYHPDIPVIQDLSLVAKPGSTVALVGHTGAGKTTLVNLLMRFYDVDSGRILLDGADISTTSRHALRSRIGMVLQDTWLFGGTIADNIGYGRPDATRDEIMEAARVSYVDRFVRTLPDGYDTWLSDDGGNLSAGEKQLITIARAFLARPQLLILDEATSSVDTRTEVLIEHAMGRLRRDRTSFIIAHRLSTIRDADLILVMEDGCIVEQGTHAELLARRGAYYAMTRL
ncbi:MAG: putative transporter ATP-binding protein [Mycobacterium sp.]|jgi:ABC-type multidrug transport system fused ATPase/permease subunit|nr:putative transporter ATP-binding protein [Mycobacterium sp.]